MKNTTNKTIKLTRLDNTILVNSKRGTHPFGGGATIGTTVGHVDTKTGEVTVWKYNAGSTTIIPDQVIEIFGHKEYTFCPTESQALEIFGEDGMIEYGVIHQDDKYSKMQEKEIRERN